MKHADFVPLHVHSEYSLLDGAIRIGELCDKAREFGMPAAAITDHGNMFGAVEFYQKAQKAGVKPIIGCEVYVAPESRKLKERGASEETAFHLVLLARNIEGYRNLAALITRAYTEGFYYKPRIDHELLAEYSHGLMGLSACMGGEIPYLIRTGQREKAAKTALWYQEVLGKGHFYIELQENGLDEQIALNRQLHELARLVDIPVVATNDCHYLLKEDARAHEVLLCIQTGKTMNDPGRMRFEGDGFYFRSPEEMKLAFKDLPEAVTNTRAVAEHCNLEFELGRSLLPKVEAPDGTTPSEYLARIATDGIVRKLGHAPDDEYKARLERELGVIKKMGYASYFLIVEDFIRYARENRIPVGPGRGSAAGSLVAYSVGITDIDPIKYGLLFERFLNPDRISMPDIDVDFCRDERQRVIEYVARKYGNDRVAQITTFGTMAAKAVIRDVARALDYPYADADRLSKLVPEALKMTLDLALKQEPQLKKLYQDDPQVREIIDIGKRLEGLSRHASTHAAGVVIAPEPLTQYVPLYRQGEDEGLTTQFDMSSVEAMGLIKFDFLGLKTLTVIEKALEYIHDSGAELDINRIPLDDRETFEFLGTGQSTGVFQLESSGMKEILVKMQPSRFEDLIALVALYRPGPIKSGMIDDFIKRKKGEKAIEYELPQLAEALDETYGVILYQEQVMSIANKLAGFTMGQADTLRKAMGKKKADVMDEMKGLFVEGAAKNRIPEARAARLFDLMAHFAEYGFNKSHSAAYALISYQTAYLKAHYPVHFMAATMSVDLDNSDKVVKSIKECRSMGIGILPPDINVCRKQFRVTGEAIRFGLVAVKGVGAGAIESILEARDREGEFRSVEDFLRRIDGRKVNKKVLEALAKSGAFDSLSEGLGDSPSLQALAAWRCRAMGMVASSGGGAIPSMDLFGGMDAGGAGGAPGVGMAGRGENGGGWDELELLQYEKEALGFYISGNPLMKYAPELKALGVLGTAELMERDDNAEVTVAGVVVSVRKLRTKKGDMMASFVLEDEGGSMEAVAFPDLFKARGEFIVKDAPLIVKGQLERSEKGLKIVAKGVTHLDHALEEVSGESRVYISIRGERPNLRKLRELIGRESGPLPLYLKVRTSSVEATILTNMSVKPSAGLIHSVEQYCGPGTFRIL